MKKGILLCGHGTKLKQGEEDFKKFAKNFSKVIPEDYEVEAAFLELSSPDFEVGIKRLSDRGVEEIIAVPMFLFTGVHMEVDIPCTLYKSAQKHGVSIRMARYIGECKELTNLSEALLRKAVPQEILEDRENTALVVMGVGSSKVEANADLAGVTRLVQERFECAFATMGFLSKMTYPSIEQTLETMMHLPYKNIIIQPFFFFDGVYMQRGTKAIEQLRKSFPEKEIYVANLLASHEMLHRILELRMQEVADGEVDMISQIDEDILDDYDGHGHHHGHSHKH